MIKYIKNLFAKAPVDLGANLDVRSDDEKDKDYLFEELVTTAAPVNWEEKEWRDIRQFPVFDQDGSGSCVAQTAAKQLGIIYWLRNNVYVHFSATHIYQRRKNKPAGGMWGIDAMNIVRKGVTLEALTPSQKMNDREMDGVEIEDYKKDVGDIFKIGNYVVMPIKDIETVASTIQKTGKGIMVWFYFKRDEWKREVPIVKYPDLARGGRSTARHSVTATDFLIHKGKKAIVIEDSWGVDTGNEGRRIITEDFFKERNFFCAYPIDFKFEDTTKPLPTPTPDKFKTTLRKGMRGAEVVALQDVLKGEGCFPKNINSTGYFGSITEASVKKYQTKNFLVADGIVGKLTRAKLNGL